MTTTKKKSKPKPELVEDTVSPRDLSKSQKIILTKENFTLLKNFVTGKFPECYGEPYERLKIVPETCPFCRFAGGWDYCGGATNGPVYAASGKEYFRQNRVVSVRCLSCGQIYKVTESWLLYFQVAEREAVEQT